MDIILRLKHWQVFPLLMLGFLLNNFTVEGDQTLTTILSVIGGIIYFSWPILIGHELNQLLPNHVKLNYNLFIFNGFVWLTVYLGITIISDGEGVTYNGIAALPGFYAFYALLHCLMFPARALKSIERNKKVDVGECFGTFFLILFLPIGIWFLQPRINKADERRREVSIE